MVQSDSLILYMTEEHGGVQGKGRQPQEVNTAKAIT